MGDTVIHQFDKNSEEQVRFRLSEFQGKGYFDVRLFYQDDSGEWRPTKKGVCLCIDLIPEFFEGCRILKEQA